MGEQIWSLGMSSDRVFGNPRAQHGSRSSGPMVCGDKNQELQKKGWGARASLAEFWRFDARGHGRRIRSNEIGNTTTS